LGKSARNRKTVSVGSIGASIPGLIGMGTPRAKPAADSKSALTSLSAQHAAGSLQGQIRAAREQLNDWLTCVSATTPKGQAEIRSLSAQISAAQQQIDRLPSTHGAAESLDVWA
jgi:hypothetical protein